MVFWEAPIVNRGLFQSFVFCCDKFGALMNRKLCVFLLLLSSVGQSQDFEVKSRSTGFPEFPAISNFDIPGAPVLGQPQLITGIDQEIRTEKHGLAYPAIFDWDRDGKNDLLIGEFETGEADSHIKVYLNTGTNAEPQYTGEFFYARDVDGNLITSHQWCCIGTHPRFIDLDKDGYVDILTGQYDPGLISWWRGSKKGFLPRQFVDQEGFSEDVSAYSSDELNPNSRMYWLYTSAGFADFNGDGLDDLFVGGFGELRVALNVGTKNLPKFGLRKYLLGVDGRPLSVVEPNKSEVEKAHNRKEKPNFSGVIKSFITPVDWDSDGVLDLLVTHVYADRKTKDPVVFFRGVNTDKGLRFEGAVPLFTAKDMEKTFPGCQPNIAVTDYNNDGVNDLVIGLSLPTVNGFEIDPKVAWSYLHDIGLQTPGKDAGRAVEWIDGGLEGLKEKLKKDPAFKPYYLGKLQDEKYLTLRHRGYVYVMLGQKNPKVSIAKKGVISKEAYQVPVNVNEKHGAKKGPATFKIKAPMVLNMRRAGIGDIDVIFAFQNGWHGYTDDKANTGMGLTPTTVSFEFPDEISPMSDVLKPEPKVKGAYSVYSGDEVKFSQSIRFVGKVSENPERNEYVVKVRVKYQTCNEEMCLPPVKETIELKIKVSE